MPRGDERAVKLVSPEAQVTNFSQLPGTSQVLALDVLHPRKTRAVGYSTKPKQLRYLG